MYMHTLKYILATLLIVVLDISYSHYLLLATVVLYKNFNQCCNRPTNHIFCSFVVSGGQVEAVVIEAV